MSEQEYDIKTDKKDRNNNLIFVSDALAERLQNARAHKAFTQNSLADEVKRLAVEQDEPENRTSNLDISRIETKKTRRVKLAKIKLLEQALGLEDGALSSLSTRGYENKIRAMNENMYTDEAMENERAVLFSEEQPMKINFCYNCGLKLSKSGMNFCPYCGTNLRD